MARSGYWLVPTPSWKSILLLNPGGTWYVPLDPRGGNALSLLSFSCLAGMSFRSLNSTTVQMVSKRGCGVYTFLRCLSGSRLNTNSDTCWLLHVTFGVCMVTSTISQVGNASLDSSVVCYYYIQAKGVLNPPVRGVWGWFVVNLWALTLRGCGPFRDVRDD